jgi:2-keto-3-deoxy-L-rhamnonate aldolase RhmA
MQSPNRILERIKNGEKALGLAMQYPSESMVEGAARIGFDFVSLDGQHGVVSPAQVDTICRIADGYGITVAMRVPDQEESTLFTYLDRGVKMITVPNLRNAEEAERIVKYSFYGPIGRRSATNIRVIFGAGGDAPTVAHSSTSRTKTRSSFPSSKASRPSRTWMKSSRSTASTISPADHRTSRSRWAFTASRIIPKP